MRPAPPLLPVCAQDDNIGLVSIVLYDRLNRVFVIESTRVSQIDQLSENLAQELGGKDGARRPSKERDLNLLQSSEVGEDGARKPSIEHDLNLKPIVIPKGAVGLRTRCIHLALNIVRCVTNMPEDANFMHRSQTQPNPFPSCAPRTG